MASMLYYGGNRSLQDQFDSRRIADRLEQVTLCTEFREDDRAFIESVEFFFPATADAKGRPDCSFKGGAPGSVRITEPDELVFPDHDGNGMFKSMGNIRLDPNVGILFLRMGVNPRRMRVSGTAAVARDDAAIGDFAGGATSRSRQAAGHFPELPAIFPRA